MVDFFVIECFDLAAPEGESERTKLIFELRLADQEHLAVQRKYNKVVNGLVALELVPCQIVNTDYPLVHAKYYNKDRHHQSLGLQFDFCSSFRYFLAVSASYLFTIFM